VARSIPPEEARYIDIRGSFLSQLFFLWIGRVQQYLFLTNSGGAIAVLSFMGASENVRAMLGPKWSLGFFVLGLILVGLLSAYQLHRSAMLNSEWRESLQQFFNGRITWEALTEGDQKRSYVVTGWFGYLAGYGSFICFCAGSIIGLVLLFQR
jgi:hypothetical protein